MLKVREFSTSKGDFVLVDNPVNVSEVSISEKVTLSMDGDKYKFVALLKTLTEEQAAEIVCDIQSGTVFGKIATGIEGKRVTLYCHENSLKRYVSAHHCLIEYL